MFQLRRPTAEQINAFLSRQSRLAFSYPDIEATRTGPPPGYVVDHNRLLLGRGQAVFEVAATALQRWEQFQLGWVSVCWPTAPIEPGVTVGVLARLAGLYTLSACRILYVIDEAGPLRKFGFAYCQWRDRNPQKRRTEIPQSMCSGQGQPSFGGSLSS
ncbi:MAG: DUF1990 domain-containing protein [Anaerolineae bacterium]|nr:DUF1990 domain-containing protein [Anaerolineae bacterium]